MDLGSSALMERLWMLIPLVLSLSVHEWAHAWSAWKLGDDTASLQGRLTLDPMAHIDPLGTFLLPLLGIPFGWAKPVPVNPLRFRRDVSMNTGMVITAAAGPLSNLVLALVATVSMAGLIRFAPVFLEEQQGLRFLLLVAIQMNVALALFNMLPVPPLDGSRVLQGVLPRRFQGAYERLARLGPVLLLVTIASGGYLLSGPMSAVNGLMFDLLDALVAES